MVALPTTPGSPNGLETGVTATLMLRGGEMRDQIEVGSALREDGEYSTLRTWDDALHGSSKVHASPWNIDQE